MENKWQQAQKWEEEWWGNCVNTYGEEMKQLLYAQKMGLITSPTIKTPYRFNLNGISVLDIGGGPCSLLLKCENVKGVVIDPLKLLNWTKERYKIAKILYLQMKGEHFNLNFKMSSSQSSILRLLRGKKNKDYIPSYHLWKYDEVWIYNVLPHCENPKRIIENAKENGNLIRIFEWIDTPISEGHPSSLTEKQLNEWLGGEGKVENLTGICHGKAYYGVFPTKLNK